MKKMLIGILLILCLMPNPVLAARGCCSSHGGVVGCSPSGKQVCADGTLSPSCTCTPSTVKGCTDRNAKNYNPNANSNDGSCEYYKTGCTNENSVNYDASAEKDDGSCIPIVYGCMDENAINYNSNANTSDNSCKYDVEKTLELEVNNVNNSENKELEDDNLAIGVGVIACGGIGYALYRAKKNKKKINEVRK